MEYIVKVFDETGKVILEHRNCGLEHGKWIVKNIRKTDKSKKAKLYKTEEVFVDHQH